MGSTIIKTPLIIFCTDHHYNWNIVRGVEIAVPPVANLGVVLVDVQRADALLASGVGVENGDLGDKAASAALLWLVRPQLAVGLRHDPGLVARRHSVRVFRQQPLLLGAHALDGGIELEPFLLRLLHRLYVSPGDLNAVGHDLRLLSHARRLVVAAQRLLI